MSCAAVTGASIGSRSGWRRRGGSDLAMVESVRARRRAFLQAADNAGAVRELLISAGAAIGEAEAALADLVLRPRGADAGASLGALRRAARIPGPSGTPMLDGRAALRAGVLDSRGILKVIPFHARLNPAADATLFSLTVTRPALPARARLGRVTGGPVHLRLTGPDGRVLLRLASGTRPCDVEEAVNATREETGLYARDGWILSEAFGSAASIRIDPVGGTGRVGEVLSSRGSDAEVLMDGRVFRGRGNRVFVHAPCFWGLVHLNPVSNEDPVRGAGASGIFRFSIRRSGIGFRSASDPYGTLGFPSLLPQDLGAPAVRLGGENTGGRLHTLFAGGGNDPVARPRNARGVVREALEEVREARRCASILLRRAVAPVEGTQRVALENLAAWETARALPDLWVGGTVPARLDAAGSALLSRP